MPAKKAPADGAKAKRAKKDPNAPKRGKSGYIYFTMDRRAGLKEENPDLGFGEIASALGAEWKKLSAAKKAPFLKKAVADKARYDREMVKYSGGAKKKAPAKKGKAKVIEIDADDEVCLTPAELKKMKAAATRAVKKAVAEATEVAAPEKKPRGRPPAKKTAAKKPAAVKPSAGSLAAKKAATAKKRAATLKKNKAAKAKAALAAEKAKK